MQTKTPIFPQRKKAFTLVELIIVITILAILATIAFVSFQGYSAQSRDSNRVATVKNIENGVNIFITKTGKVPEPDDVIGSGKLTTDGPVLNIVGKVGEGITRSININTLPLDPRAQEQYWYGVDTLKRYFQIGLTLESETAFAPGILPSYAGNILEAKVQGNYEYPLKLENIVYSLPSLLFLGSGGVLSNQTEFVVDEGTNVPYTFGQAKSGTQSVSEVLKIITGTGNLSLTGVSLPSMTMSDYKSSTGSEIPSAFSGMAQLLGITDKNKLGVVVYGKEFVGVADVSWIGGILTLNSCTWSGGTVAHNTSVTAYQTSSVLYGNTCTSEQRNCNNGILSGSYTFSGCTVDNPVNSCNISIPINANKTIGTPTSSNQAWQSANPSNACYFTCNSGFASNGTNCVSATGCTNGLTEITLSNGQTWACKNLGATEVGFNSNSYGNVYQWGKNNYTYWVGSSTYNFIESWYPSKNSWGGQNNTTWTGANITDRNLMQGPCGNGRHVPTLTEYHLMCDNLTSDNSCSSLSQPNIDIIRNTLLLPLGGLVSLSHFTLSSVGTTGFYWTSTPGTDTYYSRYFVYSNNFKGSGKGESKNGFYVRCIKNNP